MQPSAKTLPKGPISWMAQNSIPANLLMLLLLVAGFISAMQIRKEVFPEFDLDFVSVAVPYPGASPEEVEQGILIAVEEEVRGLEGIKEIQSVAAEGFGSVMIELQSNANSYKLLQDIKNAVDRITSFPEDIERPTVSLIENQRQVLSVVVYGDHSRETLYEFAEAVRDELLQYEGKAVPRPDFESMNPVSAALRRPFYLLQHALAPEAGITQIEYLGLPPREISVEIPQETLRAHGLTLEQVASVIGQTAIEVPGGAIQTRGGDILVRTQERRYFADEFADIEIAGTADGSQLRLGDIATITDRFEDTNEEATYNGSPAVKLGIFRTGTDDPIMLSTVAKRVIAKMQPTLPGGIQLGTWEDASEMYEGRMNLLIRNARLGLILVLILLGLFLHPRLAFWVTIGIPVSVLGSFLLIPLMGATINMISLFAFIITIGIVVDDAIMVGESIYHMRQQGMSSMDAAIHGARSIALPVHFAILTNIVTFFPLFMVPGMSGKFFLQIPAIVVPVLLLSLIESLYILPAHLAHDKRSQPIWKFLGRTQERVSVALTHHIQTVYGPALRKILRYRYATIGIGVGILILTIASVRGGLVPWSFLPRIDSDWVTAEVELPFGTPIEETRKIEALLLEGVETVIREKDEGPLKRAVYSQIGSLMADGGPDATSQGASGAHLLAVRVGLVAADERKTSGVGFANAWREAVGMPAGVKSMRISAQIHAGGGQPLDVQLSHRSVETLEAAAADLAGAIEDFAGVRDLNDGVALGKTQLSFRITDEGRSLGLTPVMLARQIRSSYYGAEALRQQRGREEVKVMVRFPEADRRALFSLEEMVVRSPGGVEIPLLEAATMEIGRSYTSISRNEGRRVLSVTADVDESVAVVGDILAELDASFLPDLVARYPGLSYSFEGQAREEMESIDALGRGFIIAMFVIYALLSIPFKSYLQPLIIMLAIPFGIVGAILGHLALGFELSLISLFGIVALSGVVVNDALVLIVEANRQRDENDLPLIETMTRAGMRRFRPIMLTSLTTFFGLLPMIAETSMQARFVIPMAISLGFGILFATFINLVLVPCVYLVLYDAQRINVHAPRGQR